MAIVLPAFKKDKLTEREQLEFLEYLAMSLKNGLSLACLLYTSDAADDYS